MEGGLSEWLAVFNVLNEVCSSLIHESRTKQISLLQCNIAIQSQFAISELVVGEKKLAVSY